MDLIRSAYRINQIFFGFRLFNSLSVDHYDVAKGEIESDGAKAAFSHALYEAAFLALDALVATQLLGGAAAASTWIVFIFMHLFNAWSGYSLLFATTTDRIRTHARVNLICHAVLLAVSGYALIQLPKSAVRDSLQFEFPLQWHDWRSAVNWAHIFINVLCAYGFIFRPWQFATQEEEQIFTSDDAIALHMSLFRQAGAGYAARALATIFIGEPHQTQLWQFHIFHDTLFLLLRLREYQRYREAGLFKRFEKLEAAVLFAIACSFCLWTSSVVAACITAQQ